MASNYFGIVKIISLMTIIGGLNRCQGRLISKTKNGVGCMSACVPYGNDRFCYTGWGSSNWDYCYLGSQPALTYFTVSGETCTSECGRFGYSYSWCFTGEGGKWDSCSVKSGLSIYGVACSGPCQPTSQQYNCFVGTEQTPIYVLGDNPGLPGSVDRFQECSLSPMNYTFFDEMDDLMKSLRGRCVRRRSRRLSENVIRNVGVLQLADRYERVFGADRHMYNSHGISVTSYVATRSPPRQGRPDELMTLVVRATVYYRHLEAYRQHGRDNIPGHIDFRMRNMDMVPGDEQGHIVAASLGGPTHDFNFLPQSCLCNRGQGGTNYWFATEQEMRDILDADHNARIDLTVVITYGDLQRSRRPTGFGLRYTARAQDNSVIHDSGDCYFSNNPSGASPI